MALHQFRATTQEPNYQSSGLVWNTKFYWRVDEVSGLMPPPFGGGVYYKGNVWIFKTTLLGLNYDLNNDGLVNFKDYAILTNDWNFTGLGFSGDINKDRIVNFLDFTIIAEQWMGEE